MNSGVSKYIHGASDRPSSVCTGLTKKTLRSNRNLPFSTDIKIMTIIWDFVNSHKRFVFGDEGPFHSSGMSKKAVWNTMLNVLYLCNFAAQSFFIAIHTHRVPIYSIFSVDRGKRKCLPKDTYDTPALKTCGHSTFLPILKIKKSWNIKDNNEKALSKFFEIETHFVRLVQLKTIWRHLVTKL